MNTKTYEKLELDKILGRLAGYASFSAGKAILQNIQPTTYLEEAQHRLQETTEARTLLGEQPSITIGGARDVRPHVRNAERAITLNPSQLLEIKDTLVSSGRLRKTLSTTAARFPLLGELSISLYEGKPIIAAINKTIDDDGLVLDSASPELNSIRRNLRVTHDRLQSKLQSIVGSSQNTPYLQEALVTLRSGRYVIPVKAEHKGRIKGIVHDHSSSGATVFIEPMATVELNNKIRELELEEADEIQRILSELTAHIADAADEIVWTVEALADLDSAFARAKYANDLNAEPPTLVEFDPDSYPGSTIRLYNARHPLLDQETVVPIDVELSDETYILVITGPNTGGKTVSLKTVGLLILMAQCGLHIPADEDSVLTVFEKVFADIDERQSIEQSLSTFSAHLTHIIHILEEADERSLVLLDELGQGTDPTEGAALARAIMNDLLMRGVTSFVATHYPELKLYGHSTTGVQNASVEFDIETLSPTYRLIIGLPGRSNALAIASRLGLTPAIIEEARGYIGQDDLAADDLLDEIHQKRDEIRQAHDRLARAERDANRLQDELQQRLNNIEHEREQVIEEAREEAQAEVEWLRQEISELRKRLKTLSPTQKQVMGDALLEIEELEEEAVTLDEMAKSPVQRKTRPARPPRKPESSPVRKEALEVGDRVYVRSLRSEGDITAMDNGSEIEVMVGNMRVRVDADNLEFRGKQKKYKTSDRDSLTGYVSGPRPESPGVELHLRGYTSEDARPVVEEYLDQAYLAGLPWVRIVHGKGTGVLRKAVRELCKDHPLVHEYHKAPENEGGDGVTIVRFNPLS